jgi:hypothetical protein
MNCEDVAPDLITRAVDVFNLEREFGGPDKEALGKAISAALLLHERKVIDRVATILETLADATDEADTGEDDSDQGAQAFAMRWAACRIREHIPEIAAEKALYTPREGDIVEVVLAGEVHVLDDTCEACGHHSRSMWSLFDNRSKAEYYFDEAELQGRLRTRVLYRMED